MSDIDASQPDSLTERSRGNRKIKHHEFTGDDLAQLIEGNRKLSSSIVNAYAAQLQIDAEDEGLSPEWCVFSSYLGPLVLGELNEGPGHGYIAQHILGAVPDSCKDTLFARTKWIIPLCSGSPPHWILSWVDWIKKEIGIFDSLGRNSGSSYWAEPMFLRIIDRILSELDRPRTELWNESGFKRVIYSPPPLSQQMDDWACGYFILMALRAIRFGQGFEITGHHLLTETRSVILDTLLNVPTFNRAPRDRAARRYRIR